MQSPWRSIAYWLVLRGLLSFLSYRLRMTRIGVVSPPTVDWALPHQSLIKKIHIGLPTGLSYKGIFSIETPSSQMTLTYVKLT